MVLRFAISCRFSSTRRRAGECRSAPRGSSSCAPRPRLLIVVVGAAAFSGGLIHPGDLSRELVLLLRDAFPQQVEHLQLVLFVHVVLLVVVTVAVLGGTGRQ